MMARSFHFLAGLGHIPSLLAAHSGVAKKSKAATATATTKMKVLVSSLCILIIPFLVDLVDSRLSSSSSLDPKCPSHKSGKLKVFVLAGQSNMEGHGEIASTDDNGNLKNGTLLYQVRDPRTRDEFQRLWNETSNDWVTLPNVKIWFNEAGREEGINGSTIPGINGQDYSSGDLTVGYGTGGRPQDSDKPSFFGPELGFGFHLQTECNDKVLIIKNAWGGKLFESQTDVVALPFVF